MYNSTIRENKYELYRKNKHIQPLYTISIYKESLGKHPMTSFIYNCVFSQ